MEMISGLAAVILPVFLLSGLGYGWGRRGLPFDHVFITNIVTMVGSPCLIFATLSKIQFAPGRIAVMAEATVACLVLFAVAGALALRLLRLPAKVYLPSLAFPNIGNMGLPVCLFAFGDDGLALAMIYFAVTTSCQFTLGPAIAAGRLRPGGLLKVPFVYAVAAALLVALLGFKLPQWVANTAALAGGMTIPLMLIALGVALAELKIANLRRALGMSVGRLVLGLAGGWLVAEAFGLGGAMRGVVVIQSAMPVAVFNYLFARMYDAAPEEVAGMVLLSTVLSYLTLPFVVAFVI